VDSAKLKELLAYVKTTDLQEVTLEKKGILMSFRRTPEAPAPAHAAAPAMGAPQTAGEAEVPPVGEQRKVIRSTMVGTFYRSDSKDRPPLVIEGTVVSSGQPVAAVEAMKILKDVVAPSDCKILKALVENGHAVEYGQPLFEIEPVANSEEAA
jgi:acetyl-CoA carboxylase biotin carboxyl carrier protein